MMHREGMTLATALAVSVLWLGVSPAGADDPEADGNADGETGGMAEHAESGPGESRLRLDANVKYLTKYYFRGFRQEDEGLIVQPTAQLFLDVYRDGEGWLNRVSLLTGARNSLHEAQTLADGSGPDIWYESDIFGGVSMRLFDRWEAEALYVAITSPNGAFDTIQEVDLKLSYDDEGLWGESGFSVQPFAKTAIEFDNSAAGGEESILVELGAKPGMKMLLGGKLPVRLSVPIRAGLTPDRYYALPAPLGGDDDESFGYLRTGVSASAPLFFIPPEYGRWGITGGADLLHLGQNMERFNGGDETELIGRFSVGVRF